MRPRHLIASIACLWSLAAVAGEPDAEDAVVLMVLPVVVDEAAGLSQARIAALEDALTRKARSAAGLRVVPAPAVLAEDAPCRRDAACLSAHLPPRALVLDLRIARPYPDTPTLTYDLLLRRDGRWLDRKSAAVVPDALEERVAEAAAALLTPYRPDLAD
jgi:hypothetical protein